MNYCRIIRNDIRKSRLTTMITTLFVALAAMLAVSYTHLTLPTNSLV